MSKAPEKKVNPFVFFFSPKGLMTRRQGIKWSIVLTFPMIAYSIIMLFTLGVDVTIGLGYETSMIIGFLLIAPIGMFLQLYTPLILWPLIVISARRLRSRKIHILFLLPIILIFINQFLQISYFFALANLFMPILIPILMVAIVTGKKPSSSTPDSIYKLN